MDTLTEPMLKTTEDAFDKLDLKSRELVSISKLLNEKFYILRNSLEVRTDRMRIDHAFDYLKQYQEKGAEVLKEMFDSLSKAAEELRKS